MSSPSRGLGLWPSATLKIARGLTPPGFSFGRLILVDTGDLRCSAIQCLNLVFSLGHYLPQTSLPNDVGPGCRCDRYASATLPSQEPDGSAEPVRRVLPDLRKSDRYEHRAAAQRERAVRNLCNGLQN